MSDKNARFYFGNLGADIVRCITAAETKDEKRYESSIARAHRTLGLLHNENRPEAYEEALLLLRAVEYAKKSDTLADFRRDLARLMERFTVV